MKNQNPTNPTDWFTTARFGMFIHWGLYAIPARGEWVKSHERLTDSDYQKYFDSFDPTDYDPARWARLAKNAGMKYAVLTAKHHDGFCLFDSALTDYKATNTSCRRDLLTDYVAAFRAEGLKVGFYYSLLDWHHPDYPMFSDSIHPRRGDESVKDQPQDFSRYVDYLHGQVRELLTNYGKIDILWFDFSYDSMTGEKWRARELVDMARELQPGIIIDNRLGSCPEDPDSPTGYGDFTSPEQIIPKRGMTDPSGRPVPWEACITLNNNWGYHAFDHDYKSPRDVVRTLVDCVSKNGNLILNVGPDAKGNIPAESVEILRQVGDWMNKNGESIYSCGAAELPKPEWGRYTQNGDTLYAHILERGVGPLTVDNMAGKITSASFLRDGAELSNIKAPWNAADNQTDAFLNLPAHKLPCDLDTVIKLKMG